MTENNFGAPPDRWTYYDLFLGIGKDLLPVVSNPNATISPKSKMKAIGKVPSLYNGNGGVVGFSKWTQHESTGADIEDWSKNPDYGICIQTRYVRALDIDVEDKDEVARVSTSVCEYIQGITRFRPAVRMRSGSPRVLIAFTCKGEFPKRVIKTEHGMIEFLANGQQFIAEGTHPSGAKYRWIEEPEFPEITPRELEVLLESLADEFAVEEVATGGIRKRGEDLNLEDILVEQLDALSTGPDGQVHIMCPFKDEHTGDSSESATSYFPAGTGGYKQGHFKCLHAHCEKRTDDDFIEALGLETCRFEVLTPPEGEGEALPLETDKQGRPLGNLSNVTQGLSCSEYCRWYIAKDTFKELVVVKRVDVEGAVWRPLEDTDYHMFRQYFEEVRRFKPITSQLMRECIYAVAARNKFDSIIEWGNGLKWDGIPRIESFYVDYMGVEDTPYAKAVGLYTWTGMAGRAIEPGCKADMVPILVGAQGLKKSTAIEAMSPSPDLFVEISMSETEDNRVRRTKGRLVGEFGEMRGMYGGALDSLKAYLTRTHDVWVPKYMEQSVTYARRIFFMGSSNHAEMFTDMTGIRRWLPQHVGDIDLDGIRAVRDQLWAEGIAKFKLRGVVWEKAEQLARLTKEEFMIEEPWVDILAEWLEMKSLDGGKNRDRPYITTAVILEDAIGMTKSNANSGNGKRVGEAMRALGYEKTQKRADGKMLRVWTKCKMLQVEKLKQVKRV